MAIASTFISTPQTKVEKTNLKHLNPFIHKFDILRKKLLLTDYTYTGITGIIVGL